jgi:glycerol-3-phosphate acyltransferase PlsY
MEHINMYKLAITFITAYILGSIPFGLVIVKLINGLDVRKIASGRTGGTNAMRAAGLLAGFLTAILDVIKGVAAPWLAKKVLPSYPWAAAIAGLLTILGHNYSIFLIERTEEGKIFLRGGAGGATTLGTSIGLWSKSWIIILPIATIVYVVIGYASVATISIALSSMLIFIYRAINGYGPWDNILLGAGALAMVLWALQPNINRLLNGNERVVGLRALIKKH